MKFLVQNVATLAQKFVRTLAFATFSLAAWGMFGSPAGKRSLRNGLGSGTPLRLCQAGIRRSLARVYVPHGGPIWTYFTRPDVRRSKIVCCPSSVVKSMVMIGTNVSCLFPCQSNPIAWNPTFARAAVSPAWPQQSSIDKGRWSSLTTLASSFGGGGPARGPVLAPLSSLITLAPCRTCCP